MTYWWVDHTQAAVPGAGLHRHPQRAVPRRRARRRHLRQQLLLTHRRGDLPRHGLRRRERGRGRHHDAARVRPRRARRHRRRPALHRGGRGDPRGLRRRPRLPREPRVPPGRPRLPVRVARGGRLPAPHRRRQGVPRRPRRRGPRRRRDLRRRSSTRARRMLAPRASRRTTAAAADVCDDVARPARGRAARVAGYLTESAGLPEAGEAFVDAAAAFAAADAYGVDDAGVAAVADGRPRRRPRRGRRHQTTRPTPTDRPARRGRGRRRRHLPPVPGRPRRRDRWSSTTDLERCARSACPSPSPTTGRPTTAARSTSPLRVRRLRTARPRPAWFLYVQDVAAADVGQITGFTVYVDGVPYNGRRPAPRRSPTTTPRAWPRWRAPRVGTPGDDVGEPPDDAAYATSASRTRYRGDLDVDLAVLDADGEELCASRVKAARLVRQRRRRRGLGRRLRAAPTCCRPGPTSAGCSRGRRQRRGQDEGTIDAFSVTDADGAPRRSPSGAPVRHPRRRPRRRCAWCSTAPGAAAPMPTRRPPLSSRWRSPTRGGATSR